MSNLRFRLDLDAKTLRSRFNYNPDTGKFCNARGKEYGHQNARGYVTIRIQGADYLAHRLAWLYVHGEWPPLFIDHINGVTSDNRIINLRPATPLENAQNCKTMRARLNRVQALWSRA